MNGPIQQVLDVTGLKASGELICEAGGSEVHIYFQAGRIAWATDSRHPLAFKLHLEEHAGLKDEQYRSIVAECRRTRVPVGETLRASGLLTHEQVKAALRHQILLALSGLGQCAPGDKAVFLARPQFASHNIELTFDVNELLADASLAASSAPAATSASANLAAPAVEARTSEMPPAYTAARPSDPLVVYRPAPRTRKKPRWVALGAAVLVAAVAAVLAVGVTRPGAMKASVPPAAQPPLPSAFASPSPGAHAGAGQQAAVTVRGVSPTEVVFGMASPFSGAVKDLARAMRTGIETAFAAANDAGGVNGRKVRLLALDDGYDPERSRRTVQELVEERNVFGLVGNVGSATAAASVPYLLEKKVLLFGALTGSPLLRKSPPDRYVFNFRPGCAEETAAAVRYLTEVRRIAPADIAVFYQDDELGTSGLAGVEEQMRKLGQDPATLVRATYQRNTADVAQAVESVRKARSHLRAVVMVAIYPAAIQLILKTRDLGADLVFTNVSAVDSNALAEGLVAAGKGYTSNVIVTQVVPLPTSKATLAIELQAALKKYAVGEASGFVGFEGYIVGKILLEGLRRAGNDLSTEALIAALEEMHDLELGMGAPIGFSAEDHQGSHKVWGTLLEPDGSYRPLKLE